MNQGSTTITNSQLKEGYKQTEVGVIPEDWEVDTIGQSMRLLNGRAFRPIDWVDQGIPIIRIQNLNDSDAQFNYCSADTKIEDKHRIEFGDIVFAWSGTKGTSFGARIWTGLSGVLNQHIFKVIPDRRKLVPHYAFLILLNVQEEIEKQAHGFKASFVHVKKSDLIGVHLPIPSIPEQEAIAHTLSDINALIESLDRLLTKKRQIKQGAMQELLRSKDGWETTNLGSLGSFTKGSGVRKDQSLSGSLPCIRYGEIYTRHDDYIKHFYSWISSNVAETATRLKTGDLLFAGSGETKEAIGKCVAFINDIEAYAGGDIVILRLANSNAQFMGYYLNTSPVVRQKASKGQGDAVVHIGANALASIQVTIPILEEQIEIANILSDMDAEIGSIESKLIKTRQLKQGMMHELLTGRIRLVDYSQGKR
jgi:type I restriction enzyme, S subunit